jgi:hypothetical protein
LKAKSDEKAELKAKSEEKLDNESSNESNDLDNDLDNEKTNDKINDNINVPEDATDENPLGAERDESDLPFSAKENGKQQTIAERAADVEKNKVDDMKVVDNIVGQKTRKAFERLAKMMGANIQWQYSDKLGNGWIQETTDADGNVHRTIFITLDSSITEGAQFIFGHEMTHQIKNLNPAAYNELTQLVLDTYGSDAFDKAVDETMQRYSDAGFSGRARDYYAEEVVADSVGEMIRDLNLAHTLAMKMSHPLLAAIHEDDAKIVGNTKFSLVVSEELSIFAEEPSVWEIAVSPSNEVAAVSVLLSLAEVSFLAAQTLVLLMPSMRLSTIP